MSKGDLIGLRNDLEEQIDKVREFYHELVGVNRDLLDRIKTLEATVERQSTTIKVLGNQNNRR